MKRVVVIFGAGASIDYGVPTTIKLSEQIENQVCGDAWVKNQHGDDAYIQIKNELTSYLTNPGVVNFEQIYHCIHELIHFYEPISGTVDEYRPILFPFLKNKSGLTRDALRSLQPKIIETIYNLVSTSCDTPNCSLTPLRDFLSKLEKEHTTRIYTTNYDDFPIQALDKFYTGFLPTSGVPATFDHEGFWSQWNSNSLFHLHGSIHMAYANRGTAGIGELFWYEDRHEAKKNANFTGSGKRRMDGIDVARSPIIMGLDKLSCMQQRPFFYYYSALARDLMEADLIFVIGCGLTDLHVNTWLHEARSRSPRTPLLFVDRWSDGFEAERFESERKSIEMFHALNIHTN
jgi:NAD-dependent SIR2 family protein deacetylase